MEEILLTRDQLEAWSSFASEAWRPFRDAWLARGFRLPPSGSTDDDPGSSLRSRLWQIADARPNDLARWVRGAPAGSSPYAVIAYVFDRWSGIRAEAGVEDDQAQEERVRTARYGWSPAGDVVASWLRGMDR